MEHADSCQRGGGGESGGRKAKGHTHITHSHGQQCGHGLREGGGDWVEGGTGGGTGTSVIM